MDSDLVEVSVVGILRRRQRGTRDGRGDQSSDGNRHGNTGVGRDPGKVGVLFFAGVQQHDDKDEENHDGAAVDDDLNGGNELRAH